MKSESVFKSVMASALHIEMPLQWGLISFEILSRILQDIVTKVGILTDEDTVAIKSEDEDRVYVCVLRKPFHPYSETAGKIIYSRYADAYSGEPEEIKQVKK